MAEEEKEEQKQEEETEEEQDEEVQEDQQEEQAEAERHKGQQEKSDGQEEKQNQDGEEGQQEEQDMQQEEQQEQEEQEDHHQSDDSDSGGHSGQPRHEEEFEDSVVHVNRCCKVVRGGKRFSFSALVVSGNRNGKIGYGFGKANQVPDAIGKAINDSHDNMIDIPLVHGTIPHAVDLNYCSTDLLMKPACAGTGIKASLPVRTVVDLAGITDLLTKIHGSTNPINSVKAAFEGLKKLRSKEEIEQLRGRKIG